VIDDIEALQQQLMAAAVVLGAAIELLLVAEEESAPSGDLTSACWRFRGLVEEHVEVV
jgi:hypothetical protein